MARKYSLVYLYSVYYYFIFSQYEWKAESLEWVNTLCSNDHVRCCVKTDVSGWSERCEGPWSLLTPLEYRREGVYLCMYVCKFYTIAKQASIIKL